MGSQPTWKPNPKSWMLLLPTPSAHAQFFGHLISPTVGAVAAAAVLALLESDFGRAHYWLICLRVERYLSVTFELAGRGRVDGKETDEAEFALLRIGVRTYVI